MKRSKIFFIKVFLVFLFLLNAGSAAQNLGTIEGKAVDSKTGEPLAFVSVFLSQTTIGSTTDLNGLFKIGKVPKGTYILVASIVGYDAGTLEVEVKDSMTISADFRLQRSIYQFSQITVRDEVPDKWFDQLELFKKFLLGKNEFAASCVIKNPYQIDFKEGDSEFTATAREPIILLNNALGYKINCTLTSFSYNKNTRVLKFSIYPAFEEMKTASADSAEEFIKNRTNAYSGSLAQLLSLLTANNYKFRDYGFELNTSNGLVIKADEIVERDSVDNQYFLNVDGCLKVKYWNEGKKNLSTICLNHKRAEFDPAGYFYNPDDFYLFGSMATEGIATMLPRFWEEQK